MRATYTSCVAYGPPNLYPCPYPIALSRTSNPQTPPIIPQKELQGLKEKFKGDDEIYESPYADLEKSTVLQEARIFHDAKAVKEVRDYR